MKYKKNQYSEGFSFCGTAIGVVFLVWGLFSIRILWWFIISSLIGLSILIGQFAAIANRSRLRKLVKIEFETNPNVSVQDISKNTGITEKDVQAIIIDLKLRGGWKGAFSPMTGAAIPVQDTSTPEKESKFCFSCGTPLRENNAVFCAYCGARITE